MTDYILKMENITKSFPGVKALKDVCLEVRRGSVHALLGENGAGKSTLIKILNGIYKADSGDIYFNGVRTRIANTLDAFHQGISFVFQELNLISTLTVAENIFLGRPMSTSMGLVDRKQMKKQAQEILDSLSFNINANSLVQDLSVAEKQMVEIARALSGDVQFIVMDEPSATLTKKELELLFQTIRMLKQRGVTVLYISHRLEEVFELCDQATVLRDGSVVNTYPIEGLTRARLIRDMVGRSMDQEFPPRTLCASEEEVLRVEHLSTSQKLRDVNFRLKKGEILGFAGLVGSGRTEVMRALFGADTRISGDFYVGGQKVRIHTPRDAMRQGIALLPEDRKDQGLALRYSVGRNTTFANLPAVSGSPLNLILDSKKEEKVAWHYVKTLKTKTPSIRRECQFLSGGNQQKVVLAKWLFAGMDILILDEPTRGIDVGAKYDIYCLMDQLVREGKSIILISSEMPEVIALCDRVLVMNDGQIKAELTGPQINSETILEYAV